MWIIIVIVTRAVGPWLLPVVLSVLALGADLLDRPAAEPFIDNPTVVNEDEPVSAAEASRLGWPTDRHDSYFDQTPAFAVAVLTTDSEWRSCEDRICLTGTKDEVIVHDLHPRTIEVAKLSASEPRPFNALVNLGISSEQAARLLTP